MLSKMRLLSVRCKKVPYLNHILSVFVIVYKQVTWYNGSTMPINICQLCNKSFYANPSHVKNGWGKHCSKYCRDKWYSISGMFSGRNNYRWKEPIKTNCLNCNKELFIKPHRLKAGRGRYCSIYCRAVKASLGRKMTEQQKEKLRQM